MSETDTIHWEIDQLVKAELFSDHQAVLRSALRALYRSRPELKQQIVIRAYATGEISLGKAAEMLGVSHEEMKEILSESSQGVHLGPDSVEELRQDAANA